MSKTTWPRCWPRVSCFASAWKNWVSATCPARRTSFSDGLASAPSKSATRCATKVSWCGTAAMKRLAACGSLRAHGSRRGGYWRRWKRFGMADSGTKPILVFDMDGVLVDVTESYRETIARAVEHFTGSAISREKIQEYKN